MDRGCGVACIEGCRLLGRKWNGDGEQADISLAGIVSKYLPVVFAVDGARKVASSLSLSTS